LKRSQNVQSLGWGYGDGPLIGFRTHLDACDGVLGDAFMQPADFVDPVHDAFDLGYGAPRQSLIFVKGFQPLLDFQRHDFIGYGIAKPLDEAMADIVVERQLISSSVFLSVCLNEVISFAEGINS
jgi:hypothetical protein